MYRTLAHIYPKQIRANLLELLHFAHIRIEGLRFLGFTLVFSLLLSLVFAFFGGTLLGVYWAFLFILSFVFFQCVLYFWILLSADRKGKFIDLVLPDALQLMASNLRAGFTTDRALLLSARPEFGPLQDELNRVGKEVALGRELPEALQHMTTRVRSVFLSRTVELLISGLRSGGELASLLDETAADLRNQQLIQKKIGASVNMYVIFIFVAAGIASPVLFGLSSYLVEVLTKNFAAAALPEQTTLDLPIQFSQVGLGIDFIILYAVVSLCTTAVLGSFILGLISKGKEKEGVAFIFPLLMLSLLLFFITRFVIRAMLSGLLGT